MRKARFADPQDQAPRCPIRHSGVLAARTTPTAIMRFDTIKPGWLPDPERQPQAPHILIAVFGRGMLLHSLYADLSGW